MQKSYEEDQREIWETSQRLNTSHTGRSWYKYKGSLINRLIIRLLQRHTEDYSVVGPNVFIDGFPTEFDILVVKRNATPIGDTNAYKKDDVKLVIEIKKHGFYYKKIEGERKIKEYFKPFENTKKSFLYLTVQESSTFIIATRNVIDNRAFFLGVSSRNPIEGEWERFVISVQEILKKN